MNTPKKCFICSEVKDISEFYRHPMMTDGHLGKCKECTKIDVRANRLGNLDRYRAYDLERAKRAARKASNFASTGLDPFRRSSLAKGVAA